ncbi:MAG TPA: siderophore-interacting protein [Solirubrobacteraceae bacterium]|nr:siderophore-interacting protein [Solirubrobacteraceae bacterium]
MTTRLVEVRRTEPLTDHMVRIVFGGELAGFDTGAFTDHYVKIQFPPPDAPYAAPFDARQVKERFAKEQWPRTRTYTVRRFEREAGELTIDFVVHGATGVAGPWASAAQTGDRLQLAGPGGSYAPRVDAAWHLLIGDASAVPAIGAALERLPDDALAHVVLAAERQPVRQPAGTTIRWVDDLQAAVADLEFPTGAPHVFLHGEATDVREIRRHLIADRGVPRDGQSISGYWKRQRTEDDWREDKVGWSRLIEQDDRAVTDRTAVEEG